MRHIIIDLNDDAPVDAIAAAINNLIAQGDGHVSVLNPGSDRYVLEAEDWAGRYEMEDGYSDMTDEQLQELEDRLQKEIDGAVDYIGEKVWEIGRDVYIALLSEIENS